MIVLVIGISSSGILQAAAQASPESHFRYTNFGWIQTPGTNEVTIVGSHAWRVCGGVGGSANVGDIGICGSLNFGDSSSVNYYLKVTLVSNVGAGFIVGDITDVNGNPITHTYASSGPFTAFIASCCRIAGLENTGQSPFRIEAVVDMNNGNTHSPISSLPPIVFCPATSSVGTPCNFSIPAIDADSGDTQMFRQSTTAESGTNLSQSFFTIDPNSGLLSFTGTGFTPLANGDQFATAVMILEKNSQGAEIGRVGLDFFIEVSDQQNNNPPAFDFPPTPNDGTLFTPSIGSPLNFDVKCTDPDGDQVTIQGFSLPPGATFPNGQQGTPMATAPFSFTPQALGVFAMSFTCMDQNGGSTLPISILIDVQQVSVGGELLSIDNSALLLAGAQTNAFWIMSALAVIGSVAFGALYITSKKN